MVNVGKITPFLLIVILIISSSIMVESVSAQSIPKPSVPEFSIRYVAHPFDVAATFQIDPYSGQNITIREGHRIQNRSIELVIENQPFTSFRDSNGNKIELFYNVSSKGHFGKTWYYYPTWMRALPATASDNEYTILSFGLDVNYEKDNQYGFWYGDLSTGDQVDFRVQALMGYYSYPLYNIALEYNTFTGEGSDWSNTQTISIPDGAVSVYTSPNPTPTPTVPELTYCTLPIVVMFAAITVITLVFKKRGHLLETEKHHAEDA
jgi:hypothetical protein